MIVNGALDGRSNVYRWDVNTLAWVVWDGSLTTGALTIGTVNQGTGGSSAWKVDGSAVTQPVSISGSVPVTGTFWQATQPVSGAFYQATQPVSLATAPTTPVTGTFWQTTQPISAASLPSHDVTNAGTFAVQATGTVTANAGTNLNTSALALDASISTLNTSVNTLLKPANTLAAVTTVASVTNLAGQATSYGKTLTYVPVAQGAAGTTVLASANASAKHKIIGCLLTMSAAGTLKFLDGSGDLTGAMDVAASGGFVLPAALLPYQQTATNSALSITTTGGAAKGVVTILTEA